MRVSKVLRALCGFDRELVVMAAAARIACTNVLAALLCLAGRALSAVVSVDPMYGHREIRREALRGDVVAVAGRADRAEVGHIRHADAHVSGTVRHARRWGDLQSGTGTDRRSSWTRDVRSLVPAGRRSAQRSRSRSVPARHAPRAPATPGRHHRPSWRSGWSSPHPMNSALLDRQSR